MKPYEGTARSIGWKLEAEIYPTLNVHHGVVHPHGWWAADWKAAVKTSLEEREARRTAQLEVLEN